MASTPLTKAFTAPQHSVAVTIVPRAENRKGDDEAGPSKKQIGRIYRKYHRAVLNQEIGTNTAGENEQEAEDDLKRTLGKPYRRENGDQVTKKRADGPQDQGGKEQGREYHKNSTFILVLKGDEGGKHGGELLLAAVRLHRCKYPDSLVAFSKENHFYDKGRK